MTVTIAVIAAGEMGCSIGERLSRHGARVLTSLVNRSGATVDRAKRAGMIDADDDEIAASDLILSIVPPKDAVALARRFQFSLKRSIKKALYVDCNAVSINTLDDVRSAVAASGARFVDASIIGAPGRQDESGPTVYLAGELSSDVATLAALGLRARSTSGPAGAASALKMAYAGINKGLTGLAAAMTLAAMRSGAGKALREELAYSQPQLLAHIDRSLPDMYRKAYRWDFEMREVAAFSGHETAGAQIFEGIADLYAELAKDWQGGRRYMSSIDDFLADQRLVNDNVV